MQNNSRRAGAHCTPAKNTPAGKKNSRKALARKRRIRRNRLFVITILFIILMAGLIVIKHANLIPASPVSDNSDSNSSATDLQIKPVSEPSEGFSRHFGITLTKNDLYKGDLVLVNDKNPLPENFSPPTLINLYENRKGGVVGLKDSSLMLDVSAFSTLNDMFEAMYISGAGESVIVSGYRTFDYQKTLLDREVEKYKNQGFNSEDSMAKALEYVARPARSEHNYGYAIDVSAKGPGQNILDGNFEASTQGIWLKNNSWRYGYIVRYPGEKTDVTGIGFEPWHLRYVGLPHSRIMKNLNYCLEEYIDYIIKNKCFDVYIDGTAAWRIFHINAQDIAENGELAVSIPVKDDFSADKPNWAVSGDGRGGFIITLKL